MSPGRIQRLQPTGYRRTPWRNGGGVTVDIADAYRPGAQALAWDGMLWRFGHTRIERNGPFSDLSGFDRLLAVIDGRGLMLHPTGTAAIDVRQPFRTVRFPGEWKIVSDLQAGPVGVLNLMADRRAFAIELEFIRSGGTAHADRGIAVLYAAVGDAGLRIGDDRYSLPGDHALKIDTDSGFAATIETGIVAVARITPRTIESVTAN